MHIVNVLVIGYGPVMQEACRLMRERGWRIKGVMRSSGLYTFSERGELQLTLSAKDTALPEYLLSDSFLKEIDVAFIGLPTTLDGKQAMSWIQHLAKRDILIATGEKGAIANRFSWPEQVGYSATVGGGVDILGFVRRRILIGEAFSIYVIPNASLNFLRGKSTEEAVALGCMESSADDALTRVKKEMQDMLLKSSIIANACGMGGPDLLDQNQWAKPCSIPMTPLSVKDLWAVLSAGTPFRAAVVFEKGKRTELSRIGGFTFEVNDWKVTGGFIQLPERVSELLPGGLTSGVVSLEGDRKSPSVFCTHGVGAGARVTAAAMLGDAVKLIKQRNERIGL